MATLVGEIYNEDGTFKVVDRKMSESLPIATLHSAWPMYAADVAKSGDPNARFEHWIPGKRLLAHHLNKDTDMYSLTALPSTDIMIVSYAFQGMAHEVWFSQAPLTGLCADTTCLIVAQEHCQTDPP